MNKVMNSVSEYIKNDIPSFRSGDTVNVGVRVVEGNKSRVQSFEGVVIAKSSGGGMDKTFTVRKISNGVGVERIFPLNSPNVESIEVIKKGKVRRAKLYYLRELKGKAARIKEKLKNPIIFDGRNQYSIKELKKLKFEYYCIGRNKVSIDL